MEVEGFSFDRASADGMACQFNATRVQATRITSALLSCVTPKGTEGYVDVEVSMNTIDYSR